MGNQDKQGRFTIGNKAGRGNPLACHVQRLRSALLKTVSAKDMKAIIGKLVTLARSGDVAACKLLLERVLGPPLPADIIERIEALEEERDEHEP